MLRQNRITQPLPASAAHAKHRRPLCWRLAYAALGVMLSAILAAGAALYSNPALLPETVDTARAIFGPSAVAQIEAWAFQAQDGLRQARYQATGAAPHTQWAAPPAPPPRLHPSMAEPGAPSAPAPASTTGDNA